MAKPYIVQRLDTIDTEIDALQDGAISQSDLTSLQTTLEVEISSGDTALNNAKADKNHTHTASQVSGLPTTLPANGGNADTVNNHTVLTDVPVNAVFTDTTYTHPTAKQCSYSYTHPTEKQCNYSYTHPTGNGNNHIPSGGANGNLVGWSSTGTGKWVAPSTINAGTVDGFHIVKTTLASYNALTTKDANTIYLVVG